MKIFLKQNRIVISNELQQRVIEIAHENYLGIVKTIVMLRENFFLLIWKQRSK